MSCFDTKDGDFEKRDLIEFTAPLKLLVSSRNSSSAISKDLKLLMDHNEDEVSTRSFFYKQLSVRKQHKSKSRKI